MSASVKKNIRFVATQKKQIENINYYAKVNFFKQFFLFLFN